MELPNVGRKELAKQWSDWDNRVDCSLRRELKFNAIVSTGGMPPSAHA
jgi:hypothetical protein